MKALMPLFLLAVATHSVAPTVSVATHSVAPTVSVATPLPAHGSAALREVNSAATGDVGSEIREHVLDNGMKVIVWPTPGIPNVAMYLWVRAGARNEYPGITGLSHFFEHMMFNGTTRFEPGEFDRIMEAHGGRNNAYTTEDVTVYTDWFPSSVIEVIFEIEADRFANLAFDPDVIESERGVVLSERRTRVDDSNLGALYEQVAATAFIAHPYQFPVIGWPSDIAHWTHDDLESFFRTYYAPNNVTMIVSGDVEPGAVFALAERTFGPIPAQEPPPPVRTVEPQQQGERRVKLVRPAQVPLLQMAYKSPAEADPDSVALDLLLSILVGGDSSRLHRALVDEHRVVLSVNSFRVAGHDPGMTLLYATLPAGGDLQHAEDLVKRELARLVAEGVTDAELEKARNIALARHWRSLQTISGRSQALGPYEVFHGDWRALFDAPARIEAVTLEQLQEIATRVFHDDVLTVGWLVAPE